MATASESFDAKALLEEARQARELAYAPYSRFRVGAAALAKSGRIYRGCNVENVSFGLTVCAERVAIQTAVAAGDQGFLAVAVVTGSEEGTAPCGACRQVLFEFGGAELSVVLPGGGADAEPVVRRLGDLLPGGFGPSDLARGVDG
jgi:cytidine deaminase